MDTTIFAILTQDGITTGAIYALLSIALVLVFSVTRIIFLAQGEFLTFGALTLAAIEGNKLPLTVWLLLFLGIITFSIEILSNLKTHVQRCKLSKEWLLLLVKLIIFPVFMLVICYFLPLANLTMPLQIMLTMLIIVPMGPMIYRIAYQPLAHSSILVLLITSLGVHLAMTGLGLAMFGPEGSNTLPFTDAQLVLGDLVISGQSIAVIITVILLIIVMYFYLERSLAGKALRATAVNRLGARIVGIGTNHAGKLSLTISVAIGTICGILIAPFMIITYDSGFIIALKGFVGAIFAGMTSFPLAAIGSVGIGLIEVFSSFWASSFKDVIVFTVIIPIMLWRSLTCKHIDEEN